MKLTLYTDGRCVYSFFQWIPELLTLQRYSRSRAVPEWQASMMACRRTPGGRGFTSSLFSSSSTIMPAWPSGSRCRHRQYALHPF